MPGDNLEKPSASTSDRRTFLKRAGAAAGAGAAALFGINKLVSQNTPSPESSPSLTPVPKQENSPESNKVNQIEFPYYNKDSLTQEEFNSLFDKIYTEGVKVTPEAFSKTAVFFSQNQDRIQISRRKGRNLAPLPYELDNQTSEDMSFREIVVNSKAFQEYKYEPRYPGQFDPLQSHYFFPDDKKPRARHTYIAWTGNLTPEERTTQARELSDQELFKIARAITEDFNWSVTNNKFLLPSEQTPPEPPRESFPGESQT